MTISVVVLVVILSLTHYAYKIDTPTTEKQEKVVMYLLPITIFVFELLPIAACISGIVLNKKLN